MVFGTGASGFGCYAVLASDNQAGTAFVLLTGAVLLLLGLQGTPLRRLGSGDHSLELAALRRRQRAIEVVAEVRREQPPEIAAAVAEAVEAIEPLAGDPRTRSMRYEQMVKQAIERTGAQVPFVNQDGSPDDGFDFLAQMPAGTVNVEVRYRGRGPLTTYDIMAANQRVTPEMVGGFLLVTNAPLSDSVRKYNHESSADFDKFEVISWAGPADDHLLARALARNARL